MPQPVRNAPAGFLGDACPSETTLRNLAYRLRKYRTTVEIITAEYFARVAHGVAAIAVGGFQMAKEQDLERQRLAAAGDSLAASRDALVKADRDMRVLTDAMMVGYPAAVRQREMEEKAARQRDTVAELYARPPIPTTQATPTAAPAAIAPLAGLTRTAPAVAGNSSRSRATPYGHTESQASGERERARIGQQVT